MAEVGVSLGQPGVSFDQPGVNLGHLIDGLANIAMKEEVSRYAGVGDHTSQVDTMEADVLIADGVEQYSNVRRRHRLFRHASEIRGLWTFGELVTMLSTTRDIVADSGLGIQPNAGAVIRFHASAGEHRWFMKVSDRVYWFDFDGALRFDLSTGEIQSLTWTSGAGPAGSGVAGIVWEIRFCKATVAGAAAIVPAESTFRVLRDDRNRTTEWNLTRYVPLGRFGSTTDVSFGE